MENKEPLKEVKKEEKSEFQMVLDQLKKADSELINFQDAYQKASVKSYKQGIFASNLADISPEVKIDKANEDELLASNAAINKEYEKSLALLKDAIASHALYKGAASVMEVLAGGAVAKIGSHAVKNLNNPKDYQYQPDLYELVMDAIKVVQSGTDYAINANGEKVFTKPMDEKIVPNVVALVISSLKMDGNPRMEYDNHTTVNDVKNQFYKLELSFDVDPDPKKPVEIDIGYVDGKLSFDDPAFIAGEFSQALKAKLESDANVEALKAIQSDKSLDVLQKEANSQEAADLKALYESKTLLNDQIDKIAALNSKLSSAWVLEEERLNAITKEENIKKLQNGELFISKVYDYASDDIKPYSIMVSSEDSHGGKHISFDPASFVYFPLVSNGQTLVVAQRLNPDTYIKKVDVGSGKIMDKPTYIETDVIRDAKDVKVMEALGLKYLVSTVNGPSFGKVLGSQLMSDNTTTNYSLAFTLNEKNLPVVAVDIGENIPGYAKNAYTNDKFISLSSEPVVPPKLAAAGVSTKKTVPTWADVIFTDENQKSSLFKSKTGTTIVDDVTNTGFALQYDKNGKLVKYWNDPAKEGFTLAKGQNISYKDKLYVDEASGVNSGGVPIINVVNQDYKSVKVDENNIFTKLSVTNTGSKDEPNYQFGYAYKNGDLILNKLSDGTTLKIDLNGYKIDPTKSYALSLLDHCLLVLNPSPRDEKDLLWEKVPNVDVTTKSMDGRSIITYSTLGLGDEPVAEATLPMLKKDGVYTVEFNGNEFYYTPAVGVNPNNVSVKMEKTISTSNTAFKVSVDGVEVSSGKLEFAGSYTSPSKGTFKTTKIYNDYDNKIFLKMGNYSDNLRADTKKYDFTGNILDLSNLHNSSKQVVGDYGEITIGGKAPGPLKIAKIIGSKGDDTITVTEFGSLDGASVDESVETLSVNGEQVFTSTQSFDKIAAKAYNIGYNGELTIENASGIRLISEPEPGQIGHNVVVNESSDSGKITLNALNTADKDFKDFVNGNSDVKLLLNYDVNLINTNPTNTLFLSSQAAMGGVPSPDIISMSAFSGQGENYLNLVNFEEGDKLSFKIADAVLGTKGTKFDKEMSDIIATDDAGALKFDAGIALLASGRGSKDFAKAMLKADVGVANGVYLVYGDDGVSLVTSKALIHLGLPAIKTLEVDDTPANAGTITISGDVI